MGCGSMVKRNHNTLMYLQGQHGERGYTMAALLVSIGVMSVLMSAALPAWRHQAKREKEAELAFRGEQYVRAIGLWERKMGPGSRPPTLDILVEQRFLRKKYKDPMTEDGEFQPLFVGAASPPPAAGGRGGRGLGGRSVSAPITSGVQVAPEVQVGVGGGRMGVAARGGIIGVVSKSKEASIRIYKNASHYNEWRFVHAEMSTTPGGQRGSPMPGGRGSPTPGAPGGRGTPSPGGPGRGAR